MSRPHRVPADLVDAAAVHAARDAIAAALGPLAASPLDEHATSRMKAALERASSPTVRRAIRRLAAPGQSRPPLAAVSSLTTDRPAGTCPPGQFLPAALVPEGAA